MEPITGTALLGAGISAGGGILQAFQNRKNRQWSEKMMNRQREWALQDWHSQNEYNSPRAQMQRLQEAGLNPNLVYGNGTTAGNTTTGVRQSPSSNWQGQAPDVSGITNSLFSGYDLKAKKAQIDLLETQKTVQANEALLKAAKTAESTIKTAKDKFQLEQAQKLSAGVLEMQRLNLDRLSQGIDLDQKRYQLALTEQQRRQIETANNLQEAIQRIAESKSRVWLNQFEGKRKQAETDKIRKTISLMNQDTETRELDLKLKREGLQPTDPTWQRVMLQQLKKFLPDLW